MRLRLVCLAATLALMGAALALPVAPMSSDEKLLRDHNIPTDGPGLLEYLKKRTGNEISEEKIKTSIRQLGDDDFRVRDAASKYLVQAGTRARELLRSALRNPDLEVRYRALRCLHSINNDISSMLAVSCAAVRVLAERNPKGSTSVLLGQLTTSQDSSVTEEIKHALSAIASRNEKIDPALVAALRDQSALKRAAAARTLGRLKGSDHLPALRKLLADTDDDVRLNVAVALAKRGEKQAIPVLITFMDQPPTLQTGAAEDILFRLAGQDSPHLKAADAESRKDYRLAWQSWWKEGKDKVDLAVLNEAEREPGHTTVVLLDEDQIIDLDSAGKTRWAISDVPFPLDVQRLIGEKVLVAEYKAGRVTERDRKGKILWEKKIIEPLVAQRLPNGNTFIATADSLIEITRSGKEVFRHSPGNGQKIMRARKVPGGDILLVLDYGAGFVRLDRFGKQLKSFKVAVNTSGGRVDLTPAGHVLIPEIHNNRVQERDMDGKIIREISISQPITAHALPNGHVIVTSMTERRAVEFDRTGKEVWEYKRDTRVTRAVRP